MTTDPTDKDAVVLELIDDSVAADPNERDLPHVYWHYDRDEDDGSDDDLYDEDDE